MVNKVTRTALSMNILFTGGLVILWPTCSPDLMALFITDPKVVVLGQQLLVYIVLLAHLVFWCQCHFCFDHAFKW